MLVLPSIITARRKVVAARSTTLRVREARGHLPPLHFFAATLLHWLSRWLGGTKSKGICKFL